MNTFPLRSARLSPPITCIVPDDLSSYVPDNVYR